jgi:hypothetical protein
MRGDGSLVKEPGVLSFAGLIAIGIGDLAQLEYRHTGAISSDGRTTPLPAAGMQIKLPFPKRWRVPQLGVALRIGVPHEDSTGKIPILQKVSDLYFVSSLRLPGNLSAIQFHGGARISSVEANIEQNGASVDSLKTRETLILPSIAWSIQMNPTSRIIGEAEWVPRFIVRDSTTHATVETGILGRLGINWRLNQYFSMNASIGYTLDSPSTIASEGIELVNWDIRLGGEFFLPWRVPLCRGLSILCPKGGA